MTSNDDLRFFFHPQFKSLQLLHVPSSVEAKLINAYKLDADNGDPNAAFFVAASYFVGCGGEEADKGRMINWAIRAAVCGSLNAIKAIASHHGITRPLSDQDLARLFPWFLEAAKNGHRDSMLLVSW